MLQPIKNIKVGQIYRTIPNKKKPEPEYTMAIKYINENFITVVAPGGKELTQDITDVKQLNFYNMNLIASYSTIQEAVQSKEFY